MTEIRVLVLGGNVSCPVQCREFAKSIPRPFSVRYNPYTESVEVINDKPSIQKLVNDIKYTVDVLGDAMNKFK